MEMYATLTEIGLNYLFEMNTDIIPSQIPYIKHMINLYVTEQIPYDELVHQLKDLVHSTVAFERLKEIMNCAFDPIPLAPDIELNQFDARRKTRSWNKIEDNRLLYAVNKFGQDNWMQVANFVGNGRTRSMCSQRWIRVLDPKISRSHWSPCEENRLLQLVRIHGEKNWMKIANEFGNRSDVQCRYKFLQMKKAGKVNFMPYRMPDILSMRNIPMYEMFYTMDKPTKRARQTPQTQQKAEDTPVYVQPIPEASKVEEPKEVLPTQPQNNLQMRIEEQLELSESFEFFKSDPFFENWEI